MQPIVVKETTAKLSLLSDIAHVTKQNTLQKKHTISWLQFARFGTHGYHFLPHKEAQWEMLIKIVQEVLPRHKQYRLGKIVDIAAALVNTTVTDSIKQHKKTIAVKQLSFQEKQFLKMLLIDFASSPYYVPRYPWFMPIKQKGNFTWQAKNLVTGEMVLVEKKKKKGFIEYGVNSSILKSNSK